VADKVALGQVSLQVPQFSTSGPYKYQSQSYLTDKCGKAETKLRSFGYQDSGGQKITFTF